ncbi:MAG: hypothetical protein RLY40_1188 [Pseudomonadota bacterium]|jgi:hypothetical protein
MPYELSYNRERKYLEIKHANNLALDHLFNYFSISVTNIIGRKYNKVISGYSTYLRDDNNQLISYNAINYGDDSNLKATEEMTDMLFALGSYQNAVSYPFFNNEKFENWRAHIPKDSKDFILRALWKDNKISLQYFNSRSFSPCLSLYELSLYTLFKNISDISAEKINTLNLPTTIENDLSKFHF